jgi:hypothetical protein
MISSVGSELFDNTGFKLDELGLISAASFGILEPGGLLGDA